MKTVSYFKTQYFNLLMAAMNMAFAIWSFISGDEFNCLCWVIAAVVWLIMSFVNYNDERIKLLEKKAEKYDALCDLVEALREANDLDGDHDEMQDQRIKRLEDRLYDLRRNLYSSVN